MLHLAEHPNFPYLELRKERFIRIDWGGNAAEAIDQGNRLFAEASKHVVRTSDASSLCLVETGGNRSLPSPPDPRIYALPPFAILKADLIT